MCHNINLSQVIVFQNAGCVFVYFVADTKIVFSYNLPQVPPLMFWYLFLSSEAATRGIL